MAITITIGLVGLFLAFILYSAYRVKRNKGMQLNQTALKNKVEALSTGRWYLIFTAKNCGPCKAQKSMFDKNHLLYHEIKIEDDINTVREMKVMGTPTTFIMENDLIVGVKTGIFKPETN